MVYEWKNKEVECYRLYVEERRSLDEVMEYYRAKGFAPSKRAFQTQFKRWDFPSKQNPAYKNAPLVARTKELWEKNVTQKDMIRILNEEGYDIKERELMRVRAKNRWLLRVPNGTKPVSYPQNPTSFQSEEAELQNIERVVMEENQQPTVFVNGSEQLRINVTRGDSPEMPPEMRRKRQLRLEQLAKDSEERWITRKRRRRTRGWAGLPADPPGPPRFPSETTLDESKAFLSLDNDTYRRVRDEFQSICEEEGVMKKTIAGPEKWQAVKDRLIRENSHLQAVFWGEEPKKLEQKALALDVICLDVTKRMRTLERRMTIADAKNILAINPEESRQLRNSFYATLKADHFTSKLEAGDEHWNELKARWIAGSDTLKRILAPGASDPQHSTKVKAIEVLCRDVMKRLRDDQAKKDPSRKKQPTAGPGPGPARPRISNVPPVPNTVPNPVPNAIPNAVPNAVQNAVPNTVPNANYVPTAHPVEPQINKPHNPYPNEIQIDPDLLLAASDPSVNVNHHPHPHPHHHHQHQYGPTAFMPPPYQHQHNPVPVFFRLHPHSQLQQPRLNVWLGTLSTGSVMELRQLAKKEYPNSNLLRIDGIIKDAAGNDLSYRIDHDDELVAYLTHTGGGKATFVVQLAEPLSEYTPHMNA